MSALQPCVPYSLSIYEVQKLVSLAHVIDYLARECKYLSC